MASRAVISSIETVTEAVALTLVFFDKHDGFASPCKQRSPVALKIVALCLALSRNTCPCYRVLLATLTHLWHIQTRAFLVLCASWLRSVAQREERCKSRCTCNVGRSVASRNKTVESFHVDGQTVSVGRLFYLWKRHDLLYIFPTMLHLLGLFTDLLGFEIQILDATIISLDEMSIDRCRTTILAFIRMG